MKLVFGWGLQYRALWRQAGIEAIAVCGADPDIKLHLRVKGLADPSWLPRQQQIALKLVLFYYCTFCLFTQSVIHFDRYMNSTHPWRSLCPTTIMIINSLIAECRKLCVIIMQ